MAKANFLIQTENMGNSSDDGITYLVKLTREGEDEILFEENAHYIISANSFHLGTELSELCEVHRIDEYDLVLALEARETCVSFELMDSPPRFEHLKLSTYKGIKDMIGDSDLHIESLGEEKVGEHILHLVTKEKVMVGVFILSNLVRTTDLSSYRCVMINSCYSVDNRTHT